MGVQQEYIAKVLASVTSADIEASIASYRGAEDKAKWLLDLGSNPSRTRFLLSEGERLPAKAIAKYAIKNRDIDYQDRHTNDFLHVLEKLGFAIWDEDKDGKLTDEVVKNYEWSRRLARRGQSRFRAEALKVWGNRCAVSGITLDAALEAAHVYPHTVGGPMKVTNSILLRVDLHRLFDGELMAIDPGTLKVCFEDEAAKAYPELSGISVKLPEGGPLAVAFNARWAKFESR